MLLFLLEQSAREGIIHFTCINGWVSSEKKRSHAELLICVNMAQFVSCSKMLIRLGIIVRWTKTATIHTVLTVIYLLCLQYNNNEFTCNKFDKFYLEAVKWEFVSTSIVKGHVLTKVYNEFPKNVRMVGGIRGVKFGCRPIFLSIFWISLWIFFKQVWSKRIYIDNLKD